MRVDGCSIAASWDCHLCQGSHPARSAKPEHARICAAQQFKLLLRQSHSHIICSHHFALRTTPTHNQLPQQKHSRICHSHHAHCPPFPSAALRNELATTEARLEQERREHSSTKQMAGARERDLEQQLQDASQALAAVQREGEGARAELRDLEGEVAVLKGEVARLTQRVGAGVGLRVCVFASLLRGL